jgi:copper chaperone CopZ
MKKKYKLEGLGCANCAAKMEDKISKLDGVKSARVSFMTESLKIEVEDEEKLDQIIDQAAKIVSSIEPETVLVK